MWLEGAGREEVTPVREFSSNTSPPRTTRLCSGRGSSPRSLASPPARGRWCSHVNDSGFWLVKEFFGMTVSQTLRTWTVAETIIGVAGLRLTMLLAAVM